MKSKVKKHSRAVQIFEPDAHTVYTIEATGHIAQVPRRTILLYYKHGLVSPATDPERAGYYFSDEAIRTLRRIEYLRVNYGVNIVGIKMIFLLMKEVERLRAEMRVVRP
jgi:MerR family transcriptional regulator/heat shock protein HspR